MQEHIKDSAHIHNIGFFQVLRSSPQKKTIMGSGLGEETEKVNRVILVR